MRLKYAAVLPAFLAVPAVIAQTESAEFTVGDIRIVSTDMSQVFSVARATAPSGP